MTWQDIVFSCCSIAFSYGLIPQLIKIIKLKKCDQFSYHLICPTTAGLWVYVVTCYSLSLHLTSIIATITAICWSFILIAKIKYRNN
jgi:uncharacterized protein with PQ loop repeat